MFDLPSPYADGSQKYDYHVGRRLSDRQPLHSRIFIYQLLVTVNIAIVSTIIGGALAFCLCFFAATNLVGAGAVRWFVRRIMEADARLPRDRHRRACWPPSSRSGRSRAIVAVSFHTIGALGKLFFEVVENADMKPDEGLRAVGATWLERVRFAIVPQVMPNFVSYALLRTEINVRASTIIGAVGGGGIGEVFRLSHRPRPCRQDLRHHHPAVRDHRRHRPVLGLAAQAAGRQGSLRVRAGEPHDDALSPRRSATRLRTRYPEVFQQPLLSALGRRCCGVGAAVLYLVFCWFFFNVGPASSQNGKWDRAAIYLADWYLLAGPAALPLRG